MLSPSLSVVMAVYNGERWLAETLASLSSQTFGDFEIVAIDDGSTDGSGRSGWAGARRRAGVAASATRAEPSIRVHRIEPVSG